MSLKRIIAGRVADILEANGTPLSADELCGLLEVPTDAGKGDLALPCFKLAKQLRLAPPAIAGMIQEKLIQSGLPSAVSRVEAVAGYLNFFASSSYYNGLLEEILRTSNFGSSNVGVGKVVCLDFSSPNIAKRFHLGHIGTTVIGNALRNIHDFCGFKTVAINHLGDWGTNFGKLISAYKLWSSREQVDANGIAELESLYVRFSKEEREDQALANMARAEFAKLEKGDAENLEIWRLIKDISLREYEKTYDLLQIKFDSYNGEAFFSDKMPAVVEELKEKELLKEDQGAQIIDLEDYNMPPVLILKSDGSTLYPTRDIAAAIWRKKEYDFHKCLYVTSNGQSLHFAQWFKVVELMGRDWAEGLVHIPYGTMSMGGEKLASRTGNIVLLDDLLAEAIAKCEQIVEEKNAELPNKKEVAKAVGVSAIVFNALSTSRIKDKNFVWEDALSFEGNTGPYVLYTYARAASLLRKAEVDPTTVELTGEYQPGAEELALIKKLWEFPDTVLRAMQEYEPSVIGRYMLTLCTGFNQFYHNCPILKSEGETRVYRLKLAAACRQVLGSAIKLLGMQRTEEI